MKKIYAYFIKNPCKLFVFLISKKFVQNVQFLENIKDMTSKALNKYKSKNNYFVNKFLPSLTKKKYIFFNSGNHHQNRKENNQT